MACNIMIDYTVISWNKTLHWWGFQSEVRCQKVKLILHVLQFQTISSPIATTSSPIAAISIKIVIHAGTSKYNNYYENIRIICYNGTVGTISELYVILHACRVIKSQRALTIQGEEALPAGNASANRLSLRSALLWWPLRAMSWRGL